MATEGLMSASDVANRLGCSLSMVAYLNSLGILPCRRFMKYRMFSSEDLETYKHRRRALANAGKPLSMWLEVSEQLEGRSKA
jgi:DNA-binding transcriptional MerR regulator